MISPQERDLMRQFGKRVSELRRKRGITQEQLAASIDVSLSTIAYLETGKRFARMVTLRKIAATLNVNIKDLFEGVK